MVGSKSAIATPRLDTRIGCPSITWHFCNSLLSSPASLGDKCNNSLEQNNNGSSWVSLSENTGTAHQQYSTRNNSLFPLLIAGCIIKIRTTRPIWPSHRVHLASGFYRFARRRCLPSKYVVRFRYSLKSRLRHFWRIMTSNSRVGMINPDKFIICFLLGRAYWMVWDEYVHLRFTSSWLAFRGKWKMWCGWGFVCVGYGKGLALFDT